MNLFGYTLRKPWAKYVDFTIDEQLAHSILMSTASHMYAGIVTHNLCDEDCEVVHYFKKIIESR